MRRLARKEAPDCQTCSSCSGHPRWGVRCTCRRRRVPIVLPLRRRWGWQCRVSQSRGLGNRRFAMSQAARTGIKAMVVMAPNGVLAGEAEVMGGPVLHPTTVDYLCGLSRNPIIEANHHAAPCPAVRMRSHLLQNIANARLHHPSLPSPPRFAPFGKPCSSPFSSRPSPSALLRAIKRLASRHMLWP